jgi:type IV secretory pathway TrbF-like protein
MTMFGFQRRDRASLPEMQQISKYYEMDGALKAYANRMAALGLTCGVLALLALGLFAYVRLQPPVVIRVDGSGEATVVGGSVLRVPNPLVPSVQAQSQPVADRGTSPTDVEGRAIVRKFLSAYLTYTPANVERQYADALNLMTANLRTFTMNKFREDDTLGKVKAEAITSSIKIRSIEAVAGMPWTFQVFAAKEIHRVTAQRIEQTEKMVCRYQIRLVYSGRTQQHPSGLLVGEFWEQQMVGDRDIGLDQRSTLLDR